MLELVARRIRHRGMRAGLWRATHGLRRGLIHRAEVGRLGLGGCALGVQAMGYYADRLPFGQVLTDAAKAEKALQEQAA